MYWQNNQRKRQWEKKKRLKDMTYQVQRLVCMGNSVNRYYYESTTTENMISPSLTRGGNGRKQGGRSYWEYSAVFNKKLQQPIDVPDIAKEIFQGTVMETINWLQWCIWEDKSGWTNDCVRGCLCEKFPKTDGTELGINADDYCYSTAEHVQYFDNYSTGALKGFVDAD